MISSIETLTQEFKFKITVFVYLENSVGKKVGGFYPTTQNEATI